MAKGSSLTESVGDAVRACKPGNWWDALPKETQSELLDIRKRFQNGEYPVKRLTLARILSDKCRERGIHSCKEKRFAEWLAKN
jgi:hypothetical protein